MVQVFFQKPDVYGQVHPIETEELRDAKLKELDQEVAKLHLKTKEYLLQAQDKCPELLTEDFKLAFLRCEVFHAKRAAQRYATYWRKRVTLFGPDKAFLPLTLSQALQDDRLALEMGYYNIYTSIVDGRSVLFLDPSLYSHDKYHHDIDSLIRALWYVVHVAVLENPQSQQRGIIIVECGLDSQMMNQWDMRVAKANIDAMIGAMPIRLSGIHVCHPMWFFSILWKMIYVFIPRRLRQRVHLHRGTPQQVLGGLEEFGLPPKDVAQKLGGDVPIDVLKWLEERRHQNL